MGMGISVVRLSESEDPDMRPARDLLAAEGEFCPLGLDGVLLVTPFSSFPSAFSGADAGPDEVLEDEREFLALWESAFAGTAHPRHLALAGGSLSFGVAGLVTDPPCPPAYVVLSPDRIAVMPAAAARRHVLSLLPSAGEWPGGDGFRDAALARRYLPASSMGSARTPFPLRVSRLLAHEIGHVRLRQALGPDDAEDLGGGPTAFMGRLARRELASCLVPSVYGAAAPDEWFAEAYRKTP